MTPVMSIIIPHKRTKDNNDALMLNLHLLMQYTVNSYEIIIDTEAPKDPYKIWNEVSEKARGDILIFTNSDVLMGPRWDVPFVKHAEHNAIVTGYLVEPGTIGVASQNIAMDFGRLPSTFRVDEFERYVNNNRSDTWVTEERGWYMPCAVTRYWFSCTGGFDTTNGFPYPNDIYFWERCIKEYGTKLLRVKSFAYHFQALSTRG